MKLALITLSILFTYLNVLSCFDYCTISCNDEMHTMCKYPQGGEECPNYKHGMDKNISQAILDLHNKLRQKVATGKESGQPSASNMMKLEWDAELADIAQRWSEQCKYYIQHDKCRITKDGTYTGQNVGIKKEAPRKSPELSSAEGLVNAWYKEVKLLDVSNVKYFNPNNPKIMVGHYTQMVWGTTTKVGCGLSVEKAVPFTFVIVCNYKPGGNVITREMYKTGEACSNCPTNTSCSKTYPGLCATFNDEGKENDVVSDASTSLTPFILLILFNIYLFL